MTDEKYSYWIDKHSSDPSGFYEEFLDALYNEDFVLQQWDGIGWVNIAVLNTNDYGIPYNNNFFNRT